MPRLAALPRMLRVAAAQMEFDIVPLSIMMHAQCFCTPPQQASPPGEHALYKAVATAEGKQDGRSAAGCL